MRGSTRADRGRSLYVETRVRAGVDELWRLTQTPAQHVRWDLRFTSIVPDGADASGRPRFRYSVRLPGRTVAGRGVSVGEADRTDGVRTSALRFSSPDPLSPLREGSGYWQYVPTGDGVRFLTGYRYEPGWGAVGRALDPVARPFVGWLTARSFDALRIWLEHDVPPETAHRAGAVDLALRGLAGALVAVPVGRRWGRWAAITSGLVAVVVATALPAPDTVPRARRCLRRPPDASATRPPDTLESLELPR